MHGQIEIKEIHTMTWL